MSEKNYRALLVEEKEDGTFEKSIKEVPFSFLPEHEVTIRVKAAGLNYKDALSASGHKGITRNYPHTPGVDASGIVVEDLSGTFKEGDEVICTSHDLGMNTPGGFSEFIRVPASWVVKKPSAWSHEKAMVLGTAGYTAALALWKMENSGQRPEMGPIVVTGATGGVGSLAVAILKKAGYRVWASTGKKEALTYLEELGAEKVIGREEVNDPSRKPLFKPEWAGAIDNVGGNTLTTLLRKCGRNGSVATIGLVDQAEFSMTIYPFILNGVNLLGIDSAETPQDVRQLIWNKLGKEWHPDLPLESATYCELEEIPAQMDLILRGQTKGRVVATI